MKLVHPFSKSTYMFELGDMVTANEEYDGWVELPTLQEDVSSILSGIYRRHFYSNMFYLQSIQLNNNYVVTYFSSGD